jgi:hypothetical protein
VSVIGHSSDDVVAMVRRPLLARQDDEEGTPASDYRTIVDCADVIGDQLKP